jgi:DNA (cytosine-5)-methyltransferase 1
VKTLARIESGRRFGRTFLAPFFGDGSGKTGRSLDRPLGTVTTKDRFCIVDGDWMRMLTANEYRRAMGFPTDFILPPVHKLAVALLGNAVVPAVMKHICQQVRGHAHLWN